MSLRRAHFIVLFITGIFLLLSVGIWSLYRPASALAALPEGHPPTTGGEIQALVDSTLQDFFLPGSQPGSITEEIITPEDCRLCHAGYAEQTGQEPDTETWTAWRGSMMSQAGRDPVFWAALDIANVDAAESGDICLRCHVPRGWLDGRSSPPDGSNLDEVDLEGVQCEVCHRLVDPVYSPENPSRDQDVLAGIDPALTFTGNGAIIVDPLDERRGPFNLQDDWAFNPHTPLDWPLQSPYHQEAALCGSCHDVSNPLLNWDPNSNEYVLNDLDTPADDPTTLFPIERTYSEWLLSEYNSAEGIYAPEFGGNDPYVSTCQDCHMRTITGAGGAIGGNLVVRDDLPTHDLTGGNTWVPQTLPLHPEFGDNFTGPAGELRAQALISGTIRARYMLENAASMYVWRYENQLYVWVQNESGHKLPTGYPEGRRMWLQVEGYDAGNSLVYSSGAYNVATGELSGYGTDPTLKVYETKQGLTENWAAQLGLPAGPTFHFILNNITLFDNRIPPRGYEYQAFLAAGAPPVTAGMPDPDRYAEGQYGDLTVYTLPDGVVNGTVRLLYQTASREYIEFLRDNNPNPGDPDNNGQILYDLWEMTERSRPETMVEAGFGAGDHAMYLPGVQK